MTSLGHNELMSLCSLLFMSNYHFLQGVCAGGAGRGIPSACRPRGTTGLLHDGGDDGLPGPVAIPYSCTAVPHPPVAHAELLEPPYTGWHDERRRARTRER